MQVGFIGLGRMGQVMARRILDGGHDVGMFNRTREKTKTLSDHGAKVMGSIKEAANYGEGVFTMLADDAAVEDVVTQEGGLRWPLCLKCPRDRAGASLAAPRGLLPVALSRRACRRVSCRAPSHSVARPWS